MYGQKEKIEITKIVFLRRKDNMEYKQLQEINSTLKTTDIKGKAYTEVNQRILGFRQLYPNGTIETSILSNENGVCVMEAVIKDETGKILAKGHAFETQGASYINKTSYIENCETSAIGRALGVLGIGAETSIASKEEIEKVEDSDIYKHNIFKIKERVQIVYTQKMKDGLTTKEIAEKLHKTEDEVKAIFSYFDTLSNFEKDLSNIDTKSR